MAGLSPLQLVLVGTVLEATTLLGEVPTGVVADVYSRRLSIVIGLLLTGTGFLIEGFVPRFEAILIANVVWGLGATFLSGAQQAWIADEIGEQAAAGAFLRGAQVAQLGTLVAVPPSIALGSLRLNAPIILGAAVLIGLGLLLAVVMPETGFRRRPHADRTSPLRSMTDTLREGVRLVRGSRLLLWLLILPAFYGMASEGYDRLSTPHFLRNIEFPAIGGFEPVVWFGVLRIGALLLGIGATEVVRRRLDLTSARATARVLFVADALQIGSVLVFAFAGNFVVAAAASWATSVFRRLTQPIHLAWLNQQLESRTRATVLSMSGQTDALGQIAGGPLVGVIGNASLRAAIAVAGVSLAPALLVYARAAVSGRR